MNREEANLTAALRAVPGVADAELATDTAEGVRVRLAPHADPTDVAAAVRDVLAHHGLRGRMAPPQTRIEPAGPPPPPLESATILPGPGLLQTTLIREETDADAPVDTAGGVSVDTAAGEPQVVEVPITKSPEPPPAEVARSGTLEDFVRSPEAPVPAPAAAAPEVVSDTAPADGTPGPTDADVVSPVGKSLLARVRVQEDREGVAVTVDTDDGRSVTRRGRPSDAGVREAVVAAVGALSGDQSPPVLTAVQEHTLGDQRLVTVLLQRHDGSFHVGSALIGAEKAFALARAAWAAMSQAG